MKVNVDKRKANRYKGMLKSENIYGTLKSQNLRFLIYYINPLNAE
jgi:hypothetical protein